MRYRLAILDFDGTLADSFPIFVRALNEAASRFGFLPIEVEQLEQLRGMGGRDVAATLGIPLWKTPLVARAVRRSMSRDQHEMTLFQGVPFVLRQLHQAGVVLAVVTSNSEANVRGILGQELSALVRHYECDVPVFGKARAFRRVLRQTAMPAAAALGVGDEIRDAEAASTVGIPFAAVTWGYATRTALAAASPAHLVDRVDGLADLMLNI